MPISLVLVPELTEMQADTARELHHGLEAGGLVGQREANSARGCQLSDAFPGCQGRTGSCILGAGEARCPTAPGDGEGGITT